MVALHVCRDGMLVLLLLCGVVLYDRFVIGNQCVPSGKKVSKQASASVITTSGQTRWAVVALARPGRQDIDQRNKQLAVKLKPYAKLHNISIVIFSEKEFSGMTIKKWQTLFKDVATVRYINTAANGFGGQEKFGYKYMCKFFALDIYSYLKGDYDYYMRCDTDCYLQKMDYDIFQWSEDNHVEYGFAMRKLEAHKPTRETLPQWSQDYMQKCQIKPSAVMDVPFSNCFNFYNNWHIGKVSFFTRPDVQHYLQAVNTSGYILTHRWGDSTIQAYAVRMFMKPIHIRQVPNFAYVHASHGNSMVSTFGDGAATTVPQRLPNWSPFNSTAS